MHYPIAGAEMHAVCPLQQTRTRGRLAEPEASLHPRFTQGLCTCAAMGVDCRHLILVRRAPEIEDDPFVSGAQAASGLADGSWPKHPIKKYNVAMFFYVL